MTTGHLTHFYHSIHQLKFHVARSMCESVQRGQVEIQQDQRLSEAPPSICRAFRFMSRLTLGSSNQTHQKRERDQNAIPRPHAAEIPVCQRASQITVSELPAQNVRNTKNKMESFYCSSRKTETSFRLGSTAGIQF